MYPDSELRLLDVYMEHLDLELKLHLYFEF